MRLFALVSVVFIVIALSGCTGSNKEKEAQISPNVRTVVIEVSEGSFDPDVIELVKGETVKIILKNVGSNPHDFAIDSLGVSTKTVQPGDMGSVEFMADEAGPYEFKCTMPGHSEVGEMIVIGASTLDQAESSAIDIVSDDANEPDNSTGQDL